MTSKTPNLIYKKGELYMRKYTINWRELAKGFLDLLDEEEKTIMAFGMIPAPKFKHFSKKIFERITPQHSLQEVEKTLSREIYANAKMVV